MQRLIVDSSVVVKWLNRDNEDSIDQADKILDDVRNGQVELLAPELAKYEVGNALLVGKKIDGEGIGNLIDLFYFLPITFVAENRELTQETSTLSRLLGITYYDASFLSLAKKYEATLITENIKHQGKSENIRVKCLKDY